MEAALALAKKQGWMVKTDPIILPSLCWIICTAFGWVVQQFGWGTLLGVLIFFWIRYVWDDGEDIVSFYSRLDHAHKKDVDDLFDTICSHINDPIVALVETLSSIPGITLYQKKK